MLLNLIKHQRPDIDKKYLYVKDPFEVSIADQQETKSRDQKDKTSKDIHLIFTNNCGCLSKFKRL